MTRDLPRGAVGFGFALLSAATFGTSGTFASSLMSAGWSPAAVVTTRIALAAVLLTGPALIALQGRWALLRRSAGPAVVFGLVAVAGCQLFYFNAVERLDVGVALLLEYSGILLVVLWMWARHGHRPRRLTVIGGAAALLGLTLVLHPGAGGIALVGVLWALPAAAGLAVYFVLSSRVDAAVPPLVLAWAGMWIGAAALGLLDLTGALSFHAATTDVTLARHRTSWLVPIVGLALVAAAIAYAAGITAARMLGAKLASFVGLTEVLFAVVLAWLALGQRPGALQVVGGVAVLAGIAMVRADDTEPSAAAAEPLAAATPLG